MFVKLSKNKVNSVKKVAFQIPYNKNKDKLYHLKYPGLTQKKKEIHIGEELLHARSNPKSEFFNYPILTTP